MGFQSFQDFDADDVADGLRAICAKDKINKCLLKKCVSFSILFF